ncbi:MAG: DUF1667 domain-containing protein [Candidatus Thermoplasmatota archaeon]
MDKKEITCIVCPIGCKIIVKTDGTNCEIVDGNKCKRGVGYARSEALNPKRVITTSVLVKSGEWPLVSVKTTKPVPKDSISLVLRKIRKAVVDAPVHIGDVLLENVGDLDVDVVATKNVKKCQRINIEQRENKNT